MGCEFNFTILYRVIELVFILGSLAAVSTMSYLEQLPSDFGRGLYRYIIALLSGYMFVFLADLLSRFASAPIAGAAMFVFTVLGFALFLATGTALGYTFYKVTLYIPIYAFLICEALLLAIDSLLIYGGQFKT